MTTLQKNNSCPGNERADFNYRKKWGRKGGWHLRENNIRICSTQASGSEAVGALGLQTKATKWPFHNSYPSPAPSQTNQPEVCRAAKSEGLSGSWQAGVGAMGQPHICQSQSPEEWCPQGERTHVLILRVVTRSLNSSEAPRLARISALMEP